MSLILSNDIQDLLVTSDALASQGAHDALSSDQRTLLDHHLVRLEQGDDIVLVALRKLLISAVNLSGVKWPSFKWWVHTKEVRFQHRGCDITLLVGPTASGKTTRLLELLHSTPGHTSLRVALENERNLIADRMRDPGALERLPRKGSTMFFDSYSKDEVAHLCNAFICRSIVATVQSHYRHNDRKLGLFWGRDRYSPVNTGPLEVVSLEWLKDGQPVENWGLSYQANVIIDEDGRMLKNRFGMLRNLNEDGV